MKKFKFLLSIDWEYEETKNVKVEKILTGKSHNATYRRAEKWGENCLAICGKDEQGREWTHWQLKFVENY